MSRGSIGRSRVVSASRRRCGSLRHFVLQRVRRALRGSPDLLSLRRELDSMLTEWPRAHATRGSPFADLTSARHLRCVAAGQASRSSSTWQAHGGVGAYSAALLPKMLKNIVNHMHSGSLFMASVATFPDEDPQRGIVSHITVRLADRPPAGDGAPRGGGGICSVGHAAGFGQWSARLFGNHRSLSGFPRGEEKGGGSRCALSGNGGRLAERQLRRRLAHDLPHL